MATEKPFANFMEAFHTAEQAALTKVLNGEECIAFQFLRNKIDKSEQKIIQYLYQQSLNDTKRAIMITYINSGLVRDCKMLRKYMAALPWC